MKRFLAVIIFSIIASALVAQRVESENKAAYCSRLNHSGNDFLGHLYNWQSKFLDDYDVGFYFLDISVSNASTFISGNTSITAETTAEMDTLAFELLDIIIIDSILFNGELHPEYSRLNDNVLVPVDPLSPGTGFHFTVYYHGDPGDEGFLSGLSKAYSEKYETHVVWSLSEPFGAKAWFPVKQDLEDKADSCWVFLTTDTGIRAGSQGLLTQTVDLGNGKTRFEWKSRYPIAYYLISFAAADYMEYNIYAHPEQLAGDSVLIQNFIYNDPQCLQENQWGIDQTKEMIELFSRLFVLYPFYEEKYGHCLTQLGGGMEHQTMSTMGGFSFGLVAHELGHMWFGDYVTCATWSDIWINEGFATYANYLAEEHLHGPENARNFIRSKQENVMSQPGGSTYIPEGQISPDNPWRIFNGRLSYDKGAVILHTLRHEIGDDELFFAVLSGFLEQFADSTATGDDFRKVAEEVTGMDFVQFFDQWYYGQGFPRYAIRYYSDDNFLHMDVTQTASTAATKRFDMLMDYRILFDDGSDTVVQFRQTENLQTFSVGTAKAVKEIQVDPGDWTMEQVESITSLEQTSETSTAFTLGPNPVREILHLRFFNQVSQPREISIYDISGRLVFRKEALGQRMSIKAGQFAPGTYLLHVREGNQLFVRRFTR